MLVPFLPFLQILFVWRPLSSILHALPSQTVFDFLSQQYNKPCHFTSDIMDFFLAGEDQLQTNQPGLRLTLTRNLLLLKSTLPLSCPRLTGTAL